MLQAAPSTDLRRDEVAALRAYESEIEAGLATFIRVGRALSVIRDSRLYRATHDTFEDYCRERWGWSRQHATRQIQAAEVASTLSPIGDNPSKESQARAWCPCPQASARRCGPRRNRPHRQRAAR